MPSREDLVVCYQILGLRPGASLEAVRIAYKQLVRYWHPDQFMREESMRRTAERHMKLINAAYKTLSDFLNFGPGFRFEQRRPSPPTPPRQAERPEGRGRTRTNAVSRFRARTKAWWQRIRFSFEDPEFFGPPLMTFFKKMMYGVVAWALFIGWLGGFAALPPSAQAFIANKVVLAVWVAGYLGIILYAAIREKTS